MQGVKSVVGKETMINVDGRTECEFDLIKEFSGEGHAERAAAHRDRLNSVIDSSKMWFIAYTVQL